MGKETDDIKYREFKIDVKESIHKLTEKITEKLDAQSEHLKNQSDQIRNQFEELDNKFEKHRTSIRNWLIGGLSIFCITFAYVHDRRIEVYETYNQARIARVEDKVEDIILTGISAEAISDETSGKNKSKKRKKSKKIKK